MKKSTLSLVAIAAAFLAASCQEENVMEPVNPIQDAPLFTADIESSDYTRTTVERVDGTPVTFKTKWESTDLIKINSATYQATPDKTDARKATFAMTAGTAPEATFHAYFPASIYDGTTATLPATYTYEAGKYNMPMYAESSTNSLSFKGLCAILAVKVTSEDIAALKAIKVKSNKAMSGAFTVSDNKAVLVNASDATQTVTLSSSSAVTLDATGITFYIAIPAQEYAYLEIYLSSDGTSFTRMMCTKSATGLGTLGRNTVYPIDYATNAVQLWADGPFWATTNIGAKTSTEYGQYFAWGYTTGYTHNGTAWTDGSNTKTFDSTGFSDYVGHSYSDMAAANWGTGWSVPTNEDFTKLRDTSNTSTEYVKEESAHWSTYNVQGVLFTGLGVYADNSIFLPAAWRGIGSDLKNTGDTDGHYWTSEGYNWKCSYGLGFTPTKTSSSMSCYDCIYWGQSVRPVRSLK